MGEPPIQLQVNRDADCQDQFAEQPVLLAPIPLQTSKEADCQDQFAQLQLLQPPYKQQGERHANGHVYVSSQVQYRTVNMYKARLVK